jgi:hypothetical protein
MVFVKGVGRFRNARGGRQTRCLLVDSVGCGLGHAQEGNGGMWASWRGPTDPAGLSTACGQVPQQLSTGWHGPAPSPARLRATRESTSPSPGVLSRASSPSSR